MKEISEMSKQEVIAEMNKLENEFDARKEESGYIAGEGYDVWDRWNDLDYAKTHNFPELI